MPLIATAKGGANFEPVPEDQHIARCVLVADIGTQQGHYGSKHQCIIGWELPEVLQVFDEARGEEPAMLSAFFTISLNEKANLRLMLEAWRGRGFSPAELEGFDLVNLLGVPCLLQVVHVTNPKGDTRAKVQGVSKLHKGLTCPEQTIPSRVFTLEDSDQEDFKAMPAWIQDKIKECAEYSAWVRRTAGGESQASVVDDGTDVPFQDEEESGDIPF